MGDSSAKSWNSRGRGERSELFRVPDGVAVDVVVEVGEDFVASVEELMNAVSPHLEMFGGIAAGVFGCGGSVEADVNGVGSLPERAIDIVHIVDAEGHAGFFQQPADGILEPGLLAELEDVGEIARKQRDELAQALKIEAPAGWKLVENGTQTRTQAAGA